MDVEIIRFTRSTKRSSPRCTSCAWPEILYGRKRRTPKCVGVQKREALFRKIRWCANITAQGKRKRPSRRERKSPRRKRGMSWLKMMHARVDLEHFWRERNLRIRWRFFAIDERDLAEHSPWCKLLPCKP